MGTACASRHRPALRGAALALLVCGSLALPAASSAALYKWVDANGRVVYSDQPPTGNVKAEIVQGAPPPSNPNAVKEMAAKEAEFKKRQLDATENTKKAETQRAENTKRGEQCVRTQTQIKQLAAEQIGLVRYNEKGEIVYIDDATRRKEREQLELWVKANCPT
jgi:flagellar basal body rod protein FlgG